MRKTIQRQESNDDVDSNGNNEKINKLFVLAGGGTGGHIYPAIAIAHSLKRINSETDIVFIGGRGRLEATIIPEKGFKFYPISVEGFPRKATLKWIPVILKMFQGLFQSYKYLKRLKPDVVIGTGGYVSGPVLFAASLLRIPIVIQEQNASPGLTNRILSKRVKAAYLALDSDDHPFPNNIKKITGNPIRLEITTFPRDHNTYNKYNLSPNRKTVFVMGGSQGAKVINDIMIRTCPLIVRSILMQESHKRSPQVEKIDEMNTIPLQIVHQTGKTGTENVEDAYSSHDIPHYVSPFFDQVEEIYSIADVMICRAGGMTISEVTACGIPTIFIPLPAAVGNNQVSNAYTVANAGAAVVLEQDNLQPEDVVAELVRITTDEESYQNMKTASLNLGRPKASDTIAESIYNIACSNDSIKNPQQSRVNNFI
ncbi:undecaprenyldiphospho-muramoylpentapeptide beta-N-acetylglucosaminyltransferase [Candidatus Poribacteria bacterium]|nr:MAG: undecaprenyldiphospho-muramoylpentapeptide beta-N-acetylglucosaminyltransferase [Candidatus Poribacteria bacterium]